MSITLKIPYSYIVQKRSDMRVVLDAKYKLGVDNNLVILRGREPLVREWCAHNLLYNLHIARKHTRDVDFEYPQKWYISVVWYLLSLLYWK